MQPAGSHDEDAVLLHLIAHGLREVLDDVLDDVGCIHQGQDAIQEHVQVHDVVREEGLGNGRLRPVPVPFLFPLFSLLFWKETHTETKANQNTPPKRHKRNRQNGTTTTRHHRPPPPQARMGVDVCSHLAAALERVVGVVCLQCLHQGVVVAQLVDLRVVHHLEPELEVFQPTVPAARTESTEYSQPVTQMLLLNWFSPAMKPPCTV